MPLKDPEKLKEYKKEYYEKNKEKIKEYYENNKEKIKEYNETHKEKLKEKRKEYRQTPKGIKSTRTSGWKRQGIIFSDYDLLFDMYISTTHCDFCKCLLNQCGSSRKCVDHDHDITDESNFRGILCHVCNINDVLNIID